MSRSQQSVILMIGPQAKGGITSVLRLYEDSSLGGRIRLLASHQDGSIALRVARFLIFWMQYSFILLFQPSIRVVHLHTASNGSFLRKSLALLMAKFMRKKTILHIHGAGFDQFYKQSSAGLRAWIRYGLLSADVLLVLSSQWRDKIQHICNHPDVRIIYNPIIPKAMPVEAAEPSVSGGEVRFLFMGRLHPRKGVYDILKSARLLEKAPLTIHMYGDGDVENFQQEVNKQGLTDKIRVCGWIDGPEKEAAFRGADVLILPSYQEGLPVSVLEALSYGLPVLTTPVGGIPEAVEDEVNGFLVPPGNERQLAERMKALATSGELRRRMGMAGYQLASKKFALPMIVCQLEAIYAELEGQTASSHNAN